MPTLPPRACPCCGTLVVVGQRCPRCVKAYDQARGSARKRGYDSKWECLRAAHLADHPWCEMPGCTNRATDVDHIVSVRVDPSRRLDPSNLRSLCHSHHSSKTALTDGGLGRPARRPPPRGG